MIEPRSNRREVRNPLLALPAARKLLAFLQQHPELRQIMTDLLAELARQANAKAQESWRKNKGPMAAYHMGCRAYVGHLRRVVKG